MDNFDLKKYLAEGKLHEDYTSEYDEETAKRNMFAAKYNKPGDTKRFRDYMEFLSKLRISGKTNMFGAAPYLQAEFNLDKKEARELLAYWMGSYRNPELDEGSCGYTPDGKPRSKPASPDLMKEAEYAADKFNVNVFGYQTKYYKVCPGAKAFMDKVMSGDYGDMSDIKEETIRLAKLHDVLFKMEIQALKDPNYATKILSQAKYVVDTIRDQIDTMNKGNNKNIPMEAVDYLDNHIEIIKDAGK